MTRTPDVVSGQLTTDAWGNEIRDRTIQVFATTAERDGWTAPAGAYAFVTANNATYQRNGNTWVLQGNYVSGATTATTNAAGIGVITHSLGASPTTVSLTPSSTPANLMSVKLAGRDAATISFMAYSASGSLVVNTATAVHWVAFR